MSEPTNGEWIEYRKMFESDRDSNSKKFERVFEKLEEINLSVQALRTEREVSRVTGGYVIPAVLGVAGAWVARKLGI